MKYHPHVEEAKASLQQTGGERFEIIKMLTEPSWPTYGEYYEKMWKSLFNIESKYGLAHDNEWVSVFVDDVMECKKEAPYFFMSGGKRNALIKKLRKHTEALQKLYEDNGLNQRLISNDGQFFSGFYAYDDDGNVITENGRRPKVSVSDTLEFFVSVAEDEISETAQKGKIVERQKSNRFVRCLGERNLSRYGTVLGDVVITTAFAIYEEEYTEPDISALVKGRAKAEGKK